LQASAGTGQPWRWVREPVSTGKFRTNWFWAQSRLLERPRPTPSLEKDAAHS